MSAFTSEMPSFLFPSRLPPRPLPSLPSVTLCVASRKRCKRDGRKRRFSRRTLLRYNFYPVLYVSRRLLPLLMHRSGPQVKRSFMRYGSWSHSTINAPLGPTSEEVIYALWFMESFYYGTKCEPDVCAINVVQGSTLEANH